MAGARAAGWGKWAYGALFTVVLPLALVAWARGAAANVGLPAIASKTGGLALAGAGLALWLWGTIDLRVRGGGLPMNAFPPPRLVSTGIFAVVPHPLYVGATLGCAGAALYFGSAAALWLVTPALGLGAAALWWGYERLDLRARLGVPPRAPWLGVPFDSEAPPGLGARGGAVLTALAAPALATAALDAGGLAGPAPELDAASPRVWLALAAVVAAALGARTSAALRALVLTAWLGALLLALAVVALPGGPFAGVLPIAPDRAALALAAGAGVLAAMRGLPRLGAFAGGLGACVLAGGPGLEAALAAGALVGAALRDELWQAVLRAGSWVANCWRETDLGAVRVLHIGWLAAIPAMISAAYAGVLLGPGSAAMVFGLFVAVPLGAALWAQWVEGSLPLSRPYGFFGGVIGMAVYAGLAPLLFGASPWLVLGGFAAAAPWAQGLGRLRCIANGCCHGAPCAARHGIVYHNPRTRVVRLANLGGVPIHPTQIYSLVGNVALGLLVMRLWAAGASLALVSGVYFALMGLARFVEEAWRGEPQTAIYAGLRLYQWVAVVCLVIGAALTAVPGAPPAPPALASGDVLWAGLGAFAVTWLISSVDFPRSKRRFARLA